jgi:hypothetical protein
MSRDPKSPLLKKRAMDALLESMTTDDYDSLGAHRRGESTPEAKGTEFDESLNGEGFSGSPAIIPPKDLAPPSSPDDAEFFKESQPKVGVNIHRNTKSRAHGIRCVEIAKAHPDWDASQVEAQATLVGLGVKPLEDVLGDWEKEARSIEPIEEDKADHEFFKEAPMQASAKTAGHRVEDTGEYDEDKETRIRNVAKETAQYYEHGSMFDPKGDYLCKGCHYMLGNKLCAFVEGEVSKEHGTCRYWKIADGKAPVELERKYDKKTAGYAERNDQGFGCKRCEYGGAAEKPDSDGRDSWCQFFGMHVIPDACCYENELHGDVLFNSDNTKHANFIPLANLDKKAAKTLYHITPTDKVPSIKAKGILPLQTSNWVKGDDGERYGEGEIFAMDNAEDAVRWAAKMDWEFNKGMGTGKISIISFTPGAEKWKRDTSDPISQAANKGKWLKAIGSVKPEQIGNSFVLNSEMVKSVTQGKGVKLADVPTKSYGMGTPIGGTDNPDAGASDEPEEMQDPAELGMNMTGAVYEDTEVYLKDPPLHYRPGMPRGHDLPDAEYSIGLQPSTRKPSMEEQENTQSFEDEELDDYDYDAEDARLVAIMDEEDAVFERQARLWASEVDGNDLHVAMEKIGSSEDSGWFAKSARPSDQKIELLQKQFKLTPEQIELCIAADPSPNQTDYTAWIAKQLAKGQIRLPEDTEKMKEQLGMFQKFKKSPAFTFNKDIQQYDTVKLFETLEQATAAGMGSKKEEKREKVRQGAEIVVKNGDVTIYKVTEPAAAIELGGGTNWCTAAPGNSMASHYLKDGPLYIFFDAGSAVAQLHPESNQFMNRADVCILESVTGESNYGRSEKFLADPSLARALGLLAEKEPSVREWVTENVSNPETVAKILGEESQKEVEHNTKWDESIAEYNKELAQWQIQYDQFQKDHAEWEDKRKAFQQTPQYQEWQKAHDAYQEQYDAWWRNRYDPVSGEPKARPVEPEEPEGPEEPREPSKPWNPAGDRERGYSYRTRYGDPSEYSGKKFKMQVRHALATGKALPPEIEAQLVGAHVNTELLLKYGAVFHPGQPWEPLAQTIFEKVKSRGKVDKNAIDYAAKFIKGPWPEIEPYLLEKLFLQTRNMEQMRMALDYAARGRRTRWPEFEAKLLKAKPGLASGYGCAEYAIRVLKQPWSAIPGLKRKKNGRLNPEECMIVGNPGEARRYSEAFFQGKTWDDFQRSALEANNLVALINYAADTLHTRMPELEEKILSGQKDAQESKGRQRSWTHHTDLPLTYAMKVIKGRWPEYETKILGYSKGEHKERGYHNRDEYKPSTSQRWGGRNRLDDRVANYIKNVIKGRWPEFEQILLARYETNPGQWVDNQNMLDGYLVTINETCQLRYTDNGEETYDKEADERTIKPFTKFKQDQQCYWPEGEQRLISRDPGYEKVLVDELKKRATGADDEGREGWTKGEKYVSIEDLAKMEKVTGDVDYKEREKRPSWTIWNGVWVGWWGMDAVEKYTDYLLANGVTWEEGVDIMEVHEDLEDVRGRYSYSGGRPERRQKQEAAPPPSGNYVEDPSQPGVYRQSSLLKKKALIEMAPSPSMLPPRDDIKNHIDKQEQDLLTKDIMQGVKEPLNPKKKTRRPQISPLVNPNGVTASKTAGMTEEEMLALQPGDVVLYDDGRPGHRSKGEVLEFIAPRLLQVKFEDRAQSTTIAVNKPEWTNYLTKVSSNKTAEYSQQDWEQDEQSQYFLEQVEEAEDEAKRFFMQEAYIQQLAEENHKTMDEMWNMMGDEYAAEFYGLPYKTVPDYTDQEEPDQGSVAKPKISAESPSGIEMLFADIDAAWGKVERPDDAAIQRVGQYLYKSQRATSLPSGVKLAEKWRESRWPNYHPDDKGFLESVGIKASTEKSEVRIRFRGKEEVLPTYKPEEIMKAVRHAENLSMANPGFPVVFILDEAGVVSEDTYINGNWVGPTVEKFAFRATR